jgi:hypothetical protein
MFRGGFRSLSQHDRALISVVARTNDVLKIKGYKEAEPHKALL